MATGGSDKKSKDSRNTPKVEGLAATLVFTGGALAGAALLYGAKKLYDYLSEETPKKGPPEKEGLENDPEPGRGRRTDLSEPYGGVAEDEPSLMLLSGYPGAGADQALSPQSEGASSYLSAASLHDSLLDYYTGYVDIPEMDQQLALTVVDDVMESFRYVMAELMPGLKLKGLVNSGPSAENLNVIRADHFQVTLQLALDPKVWELVDAGQTLLAAYGYQMVKRTHLEFFSRGTTPYDKFLIGEYLSPQKIKAAFLDLTNRVNNWGSIHKIQSNVIGPNVKLHVVYGEEDGERKTLTIELIPGVKLEGTQVLATTHARTPRDPCYDKLWMQSFAEEELKHLTSWRPSVSPPSTTPEGTVPKELAESDGESAEAAGSETESETVPETKEEATKVCVSEESNPGESTPEESTPEKSTPEESNPGCQLMCLKLLEAVRLNHPAQLGMLTPYSVRTIVMHCMTFEDAWHQEQLSERFLDTLKALEEYFRARNLPHFFCPKVNLLEDVDPDTLDLARDFIAHVVGNNQFPALLKSNY